MSAWESIVTMCSIALVVESSTMSVFCTVFVFTEMFEFAGVFAFRGITTKSKSWFIPVR